MGFKKGLALPELLIGLAITAGIGIIILAIYISQYKLFNKQSSLIDVATQNKLALDEMVKTIRESQSLVTSCCSSETTSSEELVLQIWPLNASGEPTDPTSGYDYIIYKRDPNNNTKLLRKIVPTPGSTRPASEKIIAVNIGTDSGDINFNYGADPAAASQIDITLKTTQTILGQTQSTTHTATAVLRNK
ncbi:hypothetical protein COT87_00345 [Candidatus Collierbacteria bacterium CG10_big_fil_rev_8_21_14_0_10_44_9]|uniref:Uncharacterized protein n=1 Tax=Candidatus Collierbacteria bacterium CG10_big_fil_rev_8_21_14_0_10_44_9 TaxID=1974535 RepID=A0A2H0VLR9_9BACT|nr:MAG: hypothetical protein COT87_00345 [Candidatus Collierbacteria bacterium CG10_big_fil_rev_8_21_14_0_10_44_9]